MPLDLYLVKFNVGEEGMPGAPVLWATLTVADRGYALFGDLPFHALG